MRPVERDEVSADSWERSALNVMAIGEHSVPPIRNLNTGHTDHTTIEIERSPKKKSPRSLSPRKLGDCSEEWMGDWANMTWERMMPMDLIRSTFWFVVRGPASCPLLWVLCGTVALIIFISIGLAAAPVELETTFDSFLKTDVESSILLDAFEAAKSSSRSEGRRLSEAATLKSTVVSTRDIFIAYELKNKGALGGLFNAELLSKIASFERSLRSTREWQDYCGRVSMDLRRFCDPGLTSLPYMMPTRKVEDGGLMPVGFVFDGKGDDPQPEVVGLSLLERHQLDKVVLPKNFDLETGGTPQFLRSAFRFKVVVAKPGDTRADKSRRSQELEEAWDTLIEAVIPLLEKGFDDDADVAMWFEGTKLFELQVIRALVSDTTLAACSMAFIFAYIVFHTGSVVLSLAGVSLCFAAVPLAYILQAIVFGVTTLSFASFLSVFLILGFGADIIFVFTDYWRESKDHRGTYDDRLLWTMWRAGKASFATTGTTALSFFSNLASVIRALRQFGLFMGICVVVAWSLIIIIFAPVCLIDEKYLSRLRPDHYCKSKGSHGKCLSWWTDKMFQSRKYCTFFFCIMSIVAVVVAGVHLQFSMDGPGIFPEDHNGSGSSKVFDEFETTEVAMSEVGQAPPHQETVCRVGNFSSNVITGCGLFWCEATDDAGWREGSCDCIRRYRSICAVPEESRARVRLIGSSGLTRSMQNNVRRWVESTLGGGTLGPTVVNEELSPQVLEKWETGAVSVEDVVGLQFSLGSVSLPSNVCGVDDVCQCSKVACLPPAGWSSPSGGRLQVVDSRRLYSWSLPLNKRGKVWVSFGLAVPTGMPLLSGDDLGTKYSFLESFQLRQPWAQRDVSSFVAHTPSHLKAGMSWNWITNFIDFVTAKAERFPLRPERFDALSAEFVASGSSSTPGTKYLWLGQGSKIKALYVSILVDFNKGSQSKAMLDYKSEWETYVDAYNKKATKYGRGAIAISSMWVDAEMAPHLMMGTLMTLIILLGLAFFGMLLFTHSFVLSLFVVGSTLLVVFLLAFFVVVVAGWPMGLLEVVAIIYFIGYAVTYSLHVVHLYADNRAIEKLGGLGENPLESGVSKSELRLLRTRHAMHDIGGAALGSSVTTMGASFFLTMCDLTIFHKLGTMCLVVSLLSIVIALGPLPAALMRCGPVHPGKMMCCRRPSGAQVRENDASAESRTVPASTKTE